MASLMHGLFQTKAQKIFEDPAMRRENESLARRLTEIRGSLVKVVTCCNGGIVLQIGLRRKSDATSQPSFGDRRPVVGWLSRRQMRYPKYSLTGRLRRQHSCPCPTTSLSRWRRSWRQEQLPWLCNHLHVKTSSAVSFSKQFSYLHTFGNSQHSQNTRPENSS